MTRTILAVAAIVLGASVALAQAGAQVGAPPAPPHMGPPPPYQLRPAYPAGDRTAAGGNGKVLFEAHCGYCHLAGGMGTNLVTKQQMMMGRTPDQGLLANRTDLTADYVKAVVRGGKGAMPTQTRVDITDAELDAVAKYLGKAG